MAEPEPPDDGTGDGDEAAGAGLTGGATDAGLTDGPAEARFLDGATDAGLTDGAAETRLTDRAAETRFLDALAGWAAGQRVAGAAASRSRLRALADAAAGSATLTGVLVDLAESRAEVAFTCAGPTGTERLSGRLIGVGRDFAVLEQHRGRPAIVRLGAVTSVWPAPRERTGGPERTAGLERTGGPGPVPGAQAGVWPIGSPRGEAAGRPGGDRPAPLALSIEAILTDLAGQGATVSVVTASGAVEGDLLSVGQDVMTLRSGGPARRVVHVPTGAVRWCELL